MSFWNKQKTEEFLTSKEYESLAKKITEVTSELEDLKIKFKMLQTECSNLRGQFNRKLSGIKKDEEEPNSLTKNDNFKTFSPFGF